MDAALMQTNPLLDDPSRKKRERMPKVSFARDIEPLFCAITKLLMRVASPWRRFRTRCWISSVRGRASTPRMNSQLWALRSLWLIIGARSDAQHREAGAHESSDI